MTQQDNASNGIGNDDLDQDGRADPTHDQAETGGSGGAGLTRHEGDGADTAHAADAASHAATESGALGAGDTRAHQARAQGEKGIGTAETGANQTPDNLAPGPASKA